MFNGEFQDFLKKLMRWMRLKMNQARGVRRIWDWQVLTRMSTHDSWHLFVSLSLKYFHNPAVPANQLLQADRVTSTLKLFNVIVTVNVTVTHNCFQVNLPKRWSRRRASSWVRGGGSERTEDSMRMTWWGRNTHTRMSSWTLWKVG